MIPYLVNKVRIERLGPKLFVKSSDRCIILYFNPIRRTVLGYEEEKVRPKRRRRLLELSEEDDDDDGGKLMIEDELLEDKQAYRSERQQEKEKPQKLISKFKIPKRRRSSDDVSDEVARIFGTSSYSVPKPVNRKESS